MKKWRWADLKLKGGFERRQLKNPPEKKKQKKIRYSRKCFFRVVSSWQRLHSRLWRSPTEIKLQKLQASSRLSCQRVVMAMSWSCSGTFEEGPWTFFFFKKNKKKKKKKKKKNIQMGLTVKKKKKKKKKKKTTHCDR
jgi:hypothetical protein